MIDYRALTDADLAARSNEIDDQIARLRAERKAVNDERRRRDLAAQDTALLASIPSEQRQRLLRAIQVVDVATTSGEM